METRKLIAFGTSSLVVSLPSDWVKRHRLKKGDEVHLTENESEIIVSKTQGTKKEVKFITIDADDKSIEMIKIEIISAYICNYDIIEIINKKRNYLEDIKKVINNLAGIEVMEETATKLVVKYLMDIKELSIEGTTRRIDVIVRSMIEDMTRCFKEDFHMSISQRDKNVNRLTILAHRTIRFVLLNPEYEKVFAMNNLDLLNSFDVVNSLEKIADHVKRISRIISNEKMNNKSKQELEKLLLKVNERYLKTMKAYYSRSKEEACRIEIDTKELIVECNKFLNKKYEGEVIRIAEFAKDIISYTKFIARVVIDR